MINIGNAGYVSFEARRLRQLEGNCGRTIRRFLSRLLENTGSLVHQNLDDGSLTSLSNSDFDAMKGYATLLQEKNEMYLATSLKLVGLNAEQSFGIVGNTYEFKLTIETATVAELQGLLFDINILADNLECYRADPAKELLRFRDLKADQVKRERRHKESLQRMHRLFASPDLVDA